MTIQHLRSSTANKRPTAAAMSDGQLAVNTNATNPGLFFKDADGSIRKVGPVFIGSSAPNSSPASGGSTGHAVGEQWLDNTGGTYVLKIWDGTAWRSESGTFVDVSGDTMTGALGVVAGSASAPGVFFSGDTNTGLLAPAADSVAITTGGTQRMRIESSGYAKFNSGFVFVQSSASGSSDSDGLALISDTNADAYVWNYENTTLRFGTNATERMRISSAGNVGIGLSAPSYEFHVKGAGTVAYFEGTGGNGFIGIEDSDDGTVAFIGVDGGSLKFQTSGSGYSDKLVIDSVGRLGLGTSSPGANLEIKAASIPVIRLNQADTYYAPIKLAGNDLEIRGSSGTIEFYNGANNGDSSTEKMRITSAGNVGIGTSSPTHQLTVHNASTTSGTIEANRFSVRNNYGSVSGLGNGLYSPSSHALAFATNSTERMRIYSDGGLNIKRYLEFRNQGDTAQAGYLSNAADVVTGSSANDFALRSEANLLFATNGATERMRITSAGNVGIGSSNPTSGKLTVVSNIDPGTTPAGIAVSMTGLGGGAATAQYGISVTGGGYNNSTTVYGVHSAISQQYVYPTYGGYFSSTGVYAQMYGIYAQATNGNANAPNNVYAGYFKTLGSVAGTNGANYGVRIENAATNGYVSYGAYISTVAGSTTVIPLRVDHAGTERMRIDSSGRLFLFSSSSATAYIQNSAAASTSNYLVIGRYGSTNNDSGSTAIQVFTNGNVQNVNNSYGAISDIKLKENIVDASSQWSDLKALKVRNYNFIEGQTHTQIGVVAQEVELVSPGLVSESPDRDNDGNDLGTVTKSVNYSVLYMKAVKALQEAMTRIETLESEVAALKAS